jgi:Na+/proline symporter
MGILQPIDWAIVIGYILLSIGIGLYLSRKGRSSTEQYFKSGGGTPWWLLGTSMVATTFAADTPLALAGFVVTTGISKNWFWWCQVPITMAGVFFFARLWKRANPMTDMEFVHVRYSGKAAKTLRGFKALYLAIPYGCLIMGWVNKAMTKIIVLCIPDFPRIPVLDTFMLWVFMVTPLSQGVDPGVKQAYFEGTLRPLEVAQSYELMKYENFQIFQEINNGVYADRANLAFKRLELQDRGITDNLSSIPEVPEELYEPKPQRTERQRAMPTAVASDMIRPVTLADGSVTSYELIKDQAGMALEAGRLEITEADFTRQAERAKAPLEEMSTLQFLRNIYDVSSGVLTYKVLFLLFLVTVAYTAISGLWGVLVTDFVQFWIAMAGCIYLAWKAVAACGGMDQLLMRMSGIYGLEKARAMVALVPTASAADVGLMSFSEFIIFILIVWWTMGFTDGGSYFAQRMLSAKDEKNAAMGFLWYGVAHYAIRMWPWLIVGFGAAVLFPYVAYPNGTMPGGEIAENGYIHTMIQLLGPGFLGVLLASFLAAYMSTISTQVNLSASYLMNDFYRPFIAPTIEKKYNVKFDEKHFVRIGILMTLLVAAAGILVSLMLNTIAGAWFLLAAFNSGIGVIYILRWYWWRINAWTEMVCLMCLFYIAAVFWWFSDYFEFFPGMPYPYNILVAAPFSVGIALLVTLFTKPTDREQLKEFCRKVQPGGPGWKDIEAEIRKDDPDFVQKSPLTWANFRNWFLAMATIYAFLFGIGKVVLGDTLYPNITFGNAFLGAAVISTLLTVLISQALKGVRTTTFILIDVALIALIFISRSMWGTQPSEYWLNTLFLNRTIGVLLLGFGLFCGYLVVQSFSAKRWVE